jgi:hypothetical protein
MLKNWCVLKVAAEEVGREENRSFLIFYINYNKNHPKDV